MRSRERLLRAYLTDGQPIGDRELLATSAREVGRRRRPRLRDVLESLEALLRRGQARRGARARELGINTGVPFFVIRRQDSACRARSRPRCCSARSERGWAELPKPIGAVPPEGAVCGPDGCD